MRYLGIGLIFLVGFTLQAQKKYNQISLELKYGAVVPVSPTQFIERSEYISFKNIQLGARYMFDQKWGLSGGYVFQRFGDQHQGLKVHGVSLEGVVSLTHVFSIPYYIKEYVNIQLHAGPGLSVAYPSSISGSDNYGNLLAGGSLLVKLSPKIALVGDVTYNYQLSQSYAYNGELLNGTGKAESGSSVFVGIGINVYLGKEKYHADWY
ncbi:hypothetical protein RBU60_07055 [Mesonia sp. MT50]|uniref:Outer membrane protein beta-barrel domain-containing protein n=1 Tax=Mesonia profundi TaxID=3070998 RepID=A0ABU1A0U7_9FLAO|nr:hypothetical protein [Mesonia profundi]MDQ7917328.1 hypothetical protein [Mesonia profundi]